MATKISHKTATESQQAISLKKLECIQFCCHGTLEACRGSAKINGEDHSLNHRIGMAVSQPTSDIRANHTGVESKVRASADQRRSHRTF